MGCQAVDLDGIGPMSAVPTCAGYELRYNLDFDTNGDDTADTPYANRMPIGIYASTFNGNGHTIANLSSTAPAAANPRLDCSRNCPAAAQSPQWV